MRLILRRMTRAAFDAAGDMRFGNADALLVTDPPALRRFMTSPNDWKELPLERDPTVDVSDFLEYEVRRFDEGVLVRIDGEGWWAKERAAIHFVHPVTLGPRPVSTGRGAI